MKYRYNIYIYVWVLLAILTGCSSEEVDDTAASVSAQLSFAVSQTSAPTTRQGGNVVQSTSVRDIELLRMIPFAIPTNGSYITTSDAPKTISFGVGAHHWYEKPTERFFHSQGVMLTPGTAAFLAYGRAIPEEGATEAENGVLTANLPTEGNPSDISFSLHQIYDNNTVPADAQAIADYLTRIANAQTTIDGTTYSWKNSTNSLLKLLYRNFIAQDEDYTSSKLAGSSANVRKFVEDLKFTLNNQSEHFIGDATATAIRSAIIAEIDDNTNFPANYPASIGLPDGAAVLMWTEAGFVPQVEPNTMADMLSIDSYCYPAELYYYANSLIRTSNVDVVSNYYSEYLSWPYLLSEHYTSGNTVKSNTQAVAIVDPLQYAVGCLQVKLQNLETTTLKDSQGQDITVTETAFPLTGVIVGGQYAVGFDFTPKSSTDATPNPERFIYDSQVKTNTAEGSDGYFYLSPSANVTNPVETLVLQSKETNDEVKIVLEFQNNSGYDFYGVNNGLVYRGTKFYMTGSVKRPASPKEDKEKRVFTQDYTTTLSVKVESLKKAYNVLPDLLSPSLEVGIQITNKWIQSTSTTVPL